ncbi:MAG: type III-B CRISPR module RAMP protein Cmr4 [Candidatus Lokiarchaeota archaeon]|nr:type III-B CRISPR module RAMP protein Cmr4 [Candidatus Lokiarchaeota archaeon]
MFKIAKPFFLHVITPLHAGTGMGLGAVDLPIQRERHTDYPKIEGSSLKGSIREVFEEFITEDGKVNNEELKNHFSGLEDKWITEKDGKKEVKKNKDKIDLTKYDQALFLSFGPEDEENTHAGALGFTDARLLFFPVKSMKGVFARITCPSILKHFLDDLKLCKNNNSINTNELDELTIPSNSDLLNSTDSKSKCIVSGDSLTIKKIDNKIDKFVILEEYAFNVIDNDIKQLVNFLKSNTGVNDIDEKLVVLHDDDFRDFVNLSTEVITRNKISNKTGTVAKGQLWTEEYLPSETTLYSLALTSPVFQEKEEDKGVFQKRNGKSEEGLVIEFFEDGIPEVVQIGGNATIGKGLVQINKWKSNNENEQASQSHTEEPSNSEGGKNESK